jgi:hypothetical protein
MATEESAPEMTNGEICDNGASPCDKTPLEAKEQDREGEEQDQEKNESSSEGCVLHVSNLTR